MKRVALVVVGIACAALGCAPKDESGGMFATAPQGSASVTASSTAGQTATDTDTEQSSGGEDTTSTSGPDTTSGETSGSTSSETSPTTSTVGTTTDATATNTGSGETTDSGGGMGQPVDGMYSHCTIAMNTCDPSPATCIEVTDGANGYCSISGCTNAAADCDPTPGGSTAPPICMQAQDAMMNPVQFCALDCSAGQPCPTGMLCVQNLMFAKGLPSYSICV